MTAPKAKGRFIEPMLLLRTDSLPNDASRWESWKPGTRAAKMADCRWLKPVLVAQIEFLEWTGENHLQHATFIALGEDKPAREVRRE